MSVSKKIAKFTKSDLGSFILTGALMTTPVAVSTTIFNTATYDFDDTVTEESQAALQQYLSENREIYKIYDNIQALDAAAKKQDNPSLVLEFNKQKHDLEDNISQKLDDFTARVLTDTRLSEKDYDKIEDVAQLDISKYSTRNLPNIAYSLQECQIDNSDINNQKQKATSIRDCMIDAHYRQHLLGYAGSLASLVMGYFLLLVLSFPIGGYKRAIQTDLSDKIEKLGNKRKPKKYKHTH